LIRREEDQTIRPARIKRSGLKWNQRIQKNHQEIRNRQEALLHDDASTEREQAPLVVEPSPEYELAQEYGGWSLRWEQPITPHEVETSGYVLQGMGIDQPVRRLIASSLAPAEAWAFRVYAEAKRWRIPLTITQVYDKSRRRPRAAIDLDSRFDAVGRMLAALDPADAEAIMALIPRHCPDDPRSVLEDPVLRGKMGAAPAAARAVWAMMAELRGCRGNTLEIDVRNGAGTAMHHPGTTDATAERAWSSALVEMRSQLPVEEFNTWIGQACLMEVADTHVIVSTPNIFVRDQLESSYRALLQTALHAVLGRSVDIHVVVGQ